MQIERHQMPDGEERLLTRIFPPSPNLKERMEESYKEAMREETCQEVKQSFIEPDDPCPCGSRKKAKNCCASRIVKRMAKQREIQKRELMEEVED